MNDHLSGKELFIRFTARAFRKLLSIYIFSYFPFGFEGRIWDLIVSVPDNCLSFYFTNFFSKKKWPAVAETCVKVLNQQLALFSLRTESDNPDATCELSP